MKEKVARPDVAIYRGTVFSRFEIACAAFVGVTLAAIWAKTGEGWSRLGFGAIGLMIGVAFGARVAEQYLDSGRFFRRSMQIFAVAWAFLVAGVVLIK